MNFWHLINLRWQFLFGRTGAINVLSYLIQMSIITLIQRILQKTVSGVHWNRRKNLYFYLGIFKSMFVFANEAIWFQTSGLSFSSFGCMLFCPVI